MAKEVQQVADNIGDPDEVNQVLLFDQVEGVGLEAGALKIETQDFSEAALWDVVRWDDSPRAEWDLMGDGFILASDIFGTLGVNTLGDVTTEETLRIVVNPQNRHIERFLDNEFEDSTTTATWGTSGSLSFSTAPEEAISTPIHYNNENILKAIVSVEGTDVDNLTYYISSDDGNNWEDVDINTVHTFINIGQSLKYKLTNASSGAEFPTPFGTWGSGGVTSAATITKLQINYEV